MVVGEWGDGRFSFEGRRHRVRDLDALPKPVQRPRPHLIVGGSGGPRSLALAARWADEYNTPFASLDGIRTRKAAIDAACAEAGREPIPFSVMTGFLCGRDEDELRERAAALAEGADADEFLASTRDTWIVGTVEECAKQLAALRELGVHRVMLQNLLHTDLAMVELIGRDLPRSLA